MEDGISIGILIYPDLTPLDAVGPGQVLTRLPGARVHYVWKTLEPITTDAGFSMVPTATLASCGPLDVLCVPGGVGQIPLMSDAEVLAFLQKQAAGARYVTSVCTGSLLLGAAGLLQGYKSACHWMWRDLLTNFGAEPVNARVVRDRNRISGGGVTAGIDFALVLAAELAGEGVARGIQLSLEYSPEPPFDSGTPERADPALVARLRAAASNVREQRLSAIESIRARAT
jgi:cyclohexyl-isocyanide hydratase